MRLKRTLHRAIMIAWKAKRKKEHGDGLSIKNRDTGGRPEQGGTPVFGFLESLGALKGTSPPPGSHAGRGTRSFFADKSKKNMVLPSAFPIPGTGKKSDDGRKRQTA